MNVVSIMAHQDDEMRCLGTMLKCRARGDTLAFITLTDGSKGFVQTPSISRKNAASIRHAEMAALAKALGAEFINLGEADEFLYDTPDVRMRLIEAIRRTRADVIFTHYQEDYNLDHMTTSSLVRHCAMQSCLPVLPTESEHLPAHPAIFLVQPHGAFAFAPSHFVDVGAHEDEKVRLMRLHRSQEEAMQQLSGAGFDVMCRRLDAYWGDMAGCAYAEAFVPMQGRGSIKAHPVLP